MDNSYIMNISQSQVIPIVNKYNLKHGLCNPIQNSPPNVWKSRLLERVNNNIYSNNSIDKTIHISREKIQVSREKIQVSK